MTRPEGTKVNFLGLRELYQRGGGRSSEAYKEGNKFPVFAQFTDRSHI